MPLLIIMIVTKDLDQGQRRTLKGLVDAAVPNCQARERYYKLAQTQGYDGAIFYLRALPAANSSTIDLIERLLNNVVKNE